MFRITRPRSRLAVTVAAVTLGLLVVASLAPAQVRRHSIEDFVAVQGTFCIDDGAGGCFLFVPPVANFFGWSDPQRGLGISVDYAGLADDYLGGEFGTTFSGSVTERPLRDGSERSLFRVELHTQNALTWVIPWSEDDENPFGDNDLLFGARVTDVEDGAEPALGDSHLIVEYTAPTGYELGDLMGLLFDENVELRSVKFNATAEGFFANGRPGRVQVTQVGLFHTGFRGAVGANFGFPVEKITLSPRRGR